MLTKREKDVLELLMQGHDNTAIGEQLGIRLPTVKLHIGNMFKKLGVTNRVQLVLEGQEMRKKRKL